MKTALKAKKEATVPPKAKAKATANAKAKAKALKAKKAMVKSVTKKVSQLHKKEICISPTFLGPKIS